DDLHDDRRVALLHQLAAGEGGRQPGRQRRRAAARPRRAEADGARARGTVVSLKLAKRLGAVKPSPTFAMAAEATALRKQGRDIVDLSVGEPDFDTPAHVQAAARDAMARGMTRYTPIGGTDDLKDAIRAKLGRENALTYERP